MEEIVVATEGASGVIEEIPQIVDDGLFVDG